MKRYLLKLIDSDIKEMERAIKNCESFIGQGANFSELTTQVKKFRAKIEKAKKSGS